MKLLIVSQHYYPDNFKVNEIAEELVKKGHNVTVLTSLPDYATGKVPKNCRGLKNRVTEHNGVKIIRSFSVARRKGVLFRALNYISFAVSSTLKVLFFKESFDLVMCYQTSPVFMANAAAMVAKKQKIPFFLYCLDLWPESLKAWNVNEKSLLFKMVGLYSKKMYNKPQLIGITSLPFEKYLVDVNGVKKEKILYMPQHFNDFCLPEKARDNFTRLAFGGNIGKVQNIECILKAVYKLSDLKNFKVDIFGDGSELSFCKKTADELNLGDSVEFHGRVNTNELYSAYINTDAFLLTLKGDSNIGLTVPAKLQEYMALNRPVIASVSGAAADIIEISGCGVCVPPDDSDALAEVIKKFVLNKEYLKHAATKGREYFELNFTLNKFLNLLEETFNRLIKEFDRE